MRRTRSFLSTTLLSLLLAVPATVTGQLPTDQDLREAFLAWDRGDYPAALVGYLDVLAGPRGGELLPVVARLTGEPFQVTEVTTDGEDIVMGPDGRLAAYAVVDGDGPATKIVDVASGGVVATLPGTGVALSGDGRVAYAVSGTSDELTRAREEAERASDREARARARSVVRWLEARDRQIRVRDLSSGAERALDLGEWVVDDLVFGGDGALFVVAGRPGTPGSNEILRVRDGAVEVLPLGTGFKASPTVAGNVLVFEVPRENPVPLPPEAEAPSGGSFGVGVADLSTGAVRVHEGRFEPAVAADGSLVAFLGRGDGATTVEAVVPGQAAPRVLVRTSMALDNPAVSPDGGTVAYQKRPVDDWEIFAVDVETGAEIQVTREIQHDLYPVFLDGSTILAAKGEGRHRRSFAYALGPDGVEVTKLFHNNTVRTIAPEYEWAPTPDGRTVMLVSERDGDTVSPERGVYLVHLDRPVTMDQVRSRLERALAAERDLRARGEEAFAPIADRVRRVTERVDVGRIYQYAEVLYSFDSKYITEPGNRMASEYIAERLREWGYEPELQWFEPRPGIRTANVIARLPGTADPDLVYVVSSHYDSTQRGPGADDNSSGTTALLEAARVMKDHAQPATIEFAFFTGEEAGLLGSREYVRRARADGKRIVGALNNDMVGWANGYRLDNTIRYSNAGIRDIQHAAAIQFSDLITYDAKYYKSTDAHAYYEAYGDIVGGIGSYPVLGNPHYHQFTDRLQTIDQRLVAEVSRTTVATLMKLASSPARVTGLEVAVRPASGAVTAEVSWDAAPESDVAGYVVRWTDASGEIRTRRVGADRTRVEIEGVPPTGEVSVRAVNVAGLAGWDWARATVE